MECKKNKFHKVIFYKYNSFSYYYCKHCKTEIISQKTLDPHKLEIEFNEKILSNLNEPNVVFPEYFMISKENDKLKLSIIDRLDNKEISLKDMTKITKPYFESVLEEYRNNNIEFLIKD
jgi:hypothetical protein